MEEGAAGETEEGGYVTFEGLELVVEVFIV